MLHLCNLQIINLSINIVQVVYQFDGEQNYSIENSENTQRN